MITIEDFAKVELKVAKVLSAERVEGSEKLLRLEVDAGDKDETDAPLRRQVLAGIGKSFTPEEMIGRSIIIVANLAPRALMGFESNGMILAATDPETGTLALLAPSTEVKAGSKIK